MPHFQAIPEWKDHQERVGRYRRGRTMHGNPDNIAVNSVELERRRLIGRGISERPQAGRRDCQRSVVPRALNARFSFVTGVESG